MKAVLTGGVHSGKTSLLKTFSCRLEKHGRQADGFLSVAVFFRGTLIGYDLLTLRDKAKLPFLRKTGQNDWIRTGPFYFLPDALAEANRILLDPAPKDVLIVDEIGPLELKGGGLWPAFAQAVEHPEFSILCVIRKILLNDFFKTVPQAEWFVFDIEEKNLLSRLLDSLAVIRKE